MDDVQASIACRQCGEVKPQTSFWRNDRNKRGRRAQCISCMSARRRLERDRLREEKAVRVAEELAARESSGKVCKKCGVRRMLDQFQKNGSGVDGRRGVCNRCRTARACEARRKARAAGKHPHPSDYPDKRRAYAATPSAKAARLDRRTKQREALADWWVRKLLAQGLQVKESQIPQALVEVKRQHLKLVRLLKEKEPA